MQRIINWTRTDGGVLYALLVGFAVPVPFLTTSGPTIGLIYAFLAAIAAAGFVLRGFLSRPNISIQQLQDITVLLGIVATTGFVYLARPVVPNSYLAYLAAVMLFGTVHGKVVAMVVGAAGVAGHLIMVVVSGGLGAVISAENLLAGAAILGVAFVYGRMVDRERRQSERAAARAAYSFDLYDELQVRSKQLAALHDMDVAIASESDLSRLLETVRKSAHSLLGAKVCHIALVNEEKRTLSFSQPYGIEPAGQPEIKLGEGIIGQVAKLGAPLLAAAEGEDSRWPYRSRNMTAVAAVPLKWQDKVLGVIQVCDDASSREFTQEDLDLLSRLASQAAVAIQNVGLMEEKVRLLGQKTEIEAEREADRLRSEFVSTVSHELRTPLSCIKGYATTLLRKDVEWDEESKREFLEIIDDESDKLRVLIDDLLDMSRIGAGVLRIEKQTLIISQLAHRVVEQAAGKTRLHKFEVDFPEDFPTVEADPRRIGQVVHNLVENAVKYSPDGGCIRVQGFVQPAEIRVAVADEGVGISTWNLPRIFERFYRVDNSITKETRGSGLGLSICRGIMEAHSGRIWAESVMGKGSTFWFSLPFKRDK